MLLKRWNIRFERKHNLYLSMGLQKFGFHSLQSLLVGLAAKKNRDLPGKYVISARWVPKGGAVLMSFPRGSLHRTLTPEMQTSRLQRACSCTEKARGWHEVTFITASSNTLERTVKHLQIAPGSRKEKWKLINGGWQNSHWTLRVRKWPMTTTSRQALFLAQEFESTTKSNLRHTLQQTFVWQE